MPAAATVYDALLRDVLAIPADDAPRLILADWLEDDGQHDRAEFIRCQVELARRVGEEAAYRPDGTLRPDGWGPGECALEERAYRLWVGAGWVREAAADVRGGWYYLGLWQDWRRGFLQTLRLSCQDFLAHAGALFGANPITRVELTDRDWIPELEDADGVLGGGPPTGRVWVGLAGEWWHWQHFWPAELFPGWDSNITRTFASAEEARAVTSAACVAHGRRLAGLEEA